MACSLMTVTLKFPLTERQRVQALRGIALPSLLSCSGTSLFHCWCFDLARLRGTHPVLASLNTEALQSSGRNGRSCYRGSNNWRAFLVQSWPSRTIARCNVVFSSPSHALFTWHAASPEGVNPRPPLRCQPRSVHLQRAPCHLVLVKKMALCVLMIQAAYACISMKT